MRVITNALLRSEVAVLAYDKRGVGGSGGEFVRTAYGDFIEDGISAVGYLKSRSDVAAEGIGLLGSSEGGWFAPEIAHRTGNVSFIVNRAGPPLPWIETNLWEIRHELMHEGVEGEALEEAIRIRGMAWHFVVEVAADLAEFDRLYGNVWECNQSRCADRRISVRFVSDPPRSTRLGSLSIGSMVAAISETSMSGAEIGYRPRRFWHHSQTFPYM